MEWLNIHTSFLDSEQFLGSDPIDRATWLCLMRYCVGQENCGEIPLAEEWGDRKWQQLVRVTLKEVRRKSPLWYWDTGSLIVWGYPEDKERIVRQKREIGRQNGLKGGRPVGSVNETKTITQTEPILVISKKTEGKGREGKEKGIGGVTAEDIYSVYPKKVGRADALKAIAKAMTRKPAQELFDKTKAYHDACFKWPKGEEKFIPHPATWFNRESYDDDPATWQRTQGDERANGRRFEQRNDYSAYQPPVAMDPDAGPLASQPEGSSAAGP
jgi:hypothetical protein